MAYFIAISIFSSCEDPNKIGLAIQPEEDLLNAIYTDTIAVSTSVFMRDSIITSGTGAYLVGSYKDDKLGRVSAEAYGEATIANNTVSKDYFIFNANRTRQIDSIVMVLEYEYYYGDTTALQNFKVYELSDTMSLINYYARNKQAYDVNTPIATVGFKPFPREVSAKKYLRIKLANTLGARILAKDTLVKTSFKKILKGLAIVPDTVNNTALLGFNISGGRSKIMLYYTSTSTTTPTDVVAKKDSLSLNNLNYYSNIVGNRSGTALANLSPSNTISSTLLGNQVFLQSGTGIRCLFNFPALPEIRNTLGNIRVIKAELVLVSAPFGPQTPPPSGLLLSFANSEGKIPLSSGLEVYLKQSQNGPNQIFEPDSTARGYVYTIPVTNYLNNILRNYQSDNGLILTNASNRFSTTRLVFGDGKSTTNPVKLKLYYIRLD